jgi:hypothetical protein
MIQGPPNPEVIAPVVVSVVFFVTTAAVLIFRPLTKRLGDRIATSRQPLPSPTDAAEVARLRQALEDTSARVDQLEQRLDFTEKLLARPREPTVALPEPRTPLPPRTPGS